MSLKKIVPWLWPIEAQAPIPHNIPYRPDIDGLRAVAVTAVVLFHLKPAFLQGGFVGVDIFFVISGTLITSLILDAAQRGRFSFRDFYSRRIRRIFPALLLVLAATLAVGWFTLLPSAYLSLVKTALSGILFVPNFRLLSEAGYFEGEPQRRALLHLWSLGVEEQFYLVWPIVALLCWKRCFVWATALIATVSFVCCLAISRTDPTLAFYLPLTRFWELLAGCLLAWRERRHIGSRMGEAKDVGGAYRNILSLVGGGLVLAAVAFTDPAEAFPSWRALPPVAGTVLLIAAGRRAAFNRFVLGNRPAVWLGQISYPLYLWHWPVLSFGWLILGGISSKITLALSVTLAASTYHFIEKPIRGVRNQKSKNSITLVLVLVSLVLGIVFVGIIGLKGAPGRFPPTISRFFTYKYDDTSSWNYSCFLQQNQRPTDWAVDRCIDKPDAKSQPLLILWGDSHAAELTPGFGAIKSSVGFRLGEMTAAGCPPVISIKVDRAPNCGDLNKFYLTKIRTLKPQSVVLAGYWYQYTFGFLPLAETIHALKLSGVENIVVLGPTTRWTTFLPELLAREAISRGGLPPAALGKETYVQMPEEGMRRLVTKAGARYVSALDILCPNGRCITRLGAGPETVTYFDESHLTEAGAKYLVSKIDPALFR